MTRQHQPFISDGRRLSGFLDDLRRHVVASSPAGALPEDRGGFVGTYEDPIDAPWSGDLSVYAISYT